MTEDDAGGDADDTVMMLETDDTGRDLETDATKVELESDDAELELESDETGFGFDWLHLYNYQRLSGSSHHKHT